MVVHMPDQAGTWLGTRRTRRPMRRKWMDYWPGPGSDRRQRAGAGRFRIAPIRLCNRRSSPSWHAVRIFRTACRPGHESDPACEAARRL